MKNLKKITFFIAFILAACFFILAVFGIKSRWGDTINHHFKGYDTIRWSSDFNDSVEICMKYDKDISEDNIENIKHIISKRLSLMGIGDYFLYFDKIKNIITINIPEAAAKPDFDFRAISTNLEILGNLKLTVKADEDDNFFAKLMKMQNQDSDPSKNEQIADDTNVVSASVIYKKNRAAMGAFKNIPSMLFVLDGETKEKFKELKKRNNENENKIKNSQEEVKKLEKEIKDLEEISKKEEKKRKQRGSRKTTRRKN